MNSKSIKGQWQASELARYLQKNAHDPLLDSKTVFLMNSKERQEIDQIIKAYLWPAVLDTLATTPFRAYGLKKTVPPQGIEDEKHVHTTRSLTFILEDPDRPLMPGGGPPWFCRGCIQCSLLDYLLSFDFYVYFPTTFNFRRILSLLADPLFSGNPPNLTIEGGLNEDRVYVVAFSHGVGAGWGMRNYQDAAQHVKEKVTQNLAVIEAITDLEKDYRSSRSFKKLQKSLREAYEAY